MNRLAPSGPSCCLSPSNEVCCEVGEAVLEVATKRFGLLTAELPLLLVLFSDSDEAGEEDEVDKGVDGIPKK